MAKSKNQKMKMLYVMQMLLEKSDENHMLSMQEIINELSKYGIEAERKSIYSDIAALQDFGLDIILTSEKGSRYFLGSRKFELAEVKILVDAVQSSKFITHKKSMQLIEKLGTLSSNHEANQLKRQTLIANRVKNIHENIYIYVDQIHGAIAADAKIKFEYCKWVIEKIIFLWYNYQDSLSKYYEM